ncbi:hypothetical protein QE440_003828 [Pseudomonas psychrotolerans]|uniref:Uncharacterized protein n=1 Tax=Pseudomonas oryzihabitans TaxID=47885 RepID=A0AAJ2BP87_9PSED|nr:hypothetical protein [Pseudomonas psychrotolerans]
METLGIEGAQLALDYPGLGDVVRQVAYIAAGEDKKGHAFAIRGAGRAVQCGMALVAVLVEQVIGPDRVLRRQDTLIQRFIRHLEQWMGAAAVEQGALLVEWQVFQAGQGIDQRQHAQVQMAVQHPGLDLAGQGHADVHQHARCGALEGGQGVGDAHTWLGDQVVDDAKVQLAAQVLVQLVDLAAKALQGGEQRLAGLEHLAAFVGQGKPRATALAEAHAQALLQIVHV